MTWAVCRSCGEMKFGAWCPCKSCQETSSMMDNLSLLLSDHYLTKEGLAEASKQLKELKQGSRSKVELPAKLFKPGQVKGNRSPEEIVLEFDDSIFQK